MLNSKCQGLNEMQELTVQAMEREVLGLIMLLGLGPRRFGEAPLISVLLEQVKLNAGSFGGTNNRLIFMAIERLYREQVNFDVVSVFEDLMLAGDQIPLQELGKLAVDTPHGLVEKVEPMARIIKAFGELRSASVSTGKPSRRIMRFRDVMERELSHGAVWWTEDPQWCLADPRGEHICYAYFPT